MPEKNLEIKIRIESAGIPSVEIYEPESGDYVCLKLTGNSEQDDRKIMDEIRSWIELLLEENTEESNDL